MTERMARRVRRPNVPLWMSFSAVALVFATPVSAAGSVARELAAVETKNKRCQDKDSSNMGLKQCTADAAAGADKILNRVYKDIVAGLKKKPDDEQEAKDNRDKLKRLVDSENAWIKFRDSDCDLQGTSMLGGSGESLVIVACEYSMTAKRAKDLDELFNGSN